MNCLESLTFPSYLSRRWVQIWVACDERARWYSDSVVFSWFLTCHDCTRIMIVHNMCCWLFLISFDYFYVFDITSDIQFSYFSASSMICLIWGILPDVPGVLNSSLAWTPAISAPRLNLFKTCCPMSQHEHGHLKFSIVLHNSVQTETLSFELPTQNFVRSWFPTWRTSLHNFACNALCAWASGLEDCTWQQIHDNNGQNTNRQKQRCLDLVIRSLQGHCLVFFHV